MKNQYKFAIKIKYLESKYTSDGKWHYHTTKWHNDSDKAWEEAERFLTIKHQNCVESSCGIIHKVVDSNE